MLYRFWENCSKKRATEDRGAKQRTVGFLEEGEENEKTE